MVQTGDPSGTGKGGKSIHPEGVFNDEIKELLKHKARGTLSMANSGPNTNGSQVSAEVDSMFSYSSYTRTSLLLQFFITYAAQPSLDLKYTVFGKVIDGFDCLDALEKMPVDPKKFRPLQETKINSVTIHANPLAD